MLLGLERVQLQPWRPWRPWTRPWVGCTLKKESGECCVTPGWWLSPAPVYWLPSRPANRPGSRPQLLDSNLDSNALVTQRKVVTQRAAESVAHGGIACKALRTPGDGELVAVDAVDLQPKAGGAVLSHCAGGPLHRRAIAQEGPLRTSLGWTFAVVTVERG